MNDEPKTYCCIDLKSFYASVECVERGEDPYQYPLVVADPTRGEKTICLAVSPALKARGIPGRCRVFEIPDGIEYEKAKPRMRLYMEVSAKIVATYLKFVSAADLHVYSIDECFIDLTPYLTLYKMSAKELVEQLRGAVYEETGITATAGIGPNLFLAKVALDVTAKHAEDNIGVLDQQSFRQIIWPHRPITDIWQIGRGIAKRLEKYGIYDLGGVAHANIDLLYKEFGINAEYLFDHAWGIEPCTIPEIKAYEPESTSFGNGQVLPCDYSFEEGRMILREMVDETALDLVDKRLVTSHLNLYVGYRKDTGPDGGEPDGGETASSGADGTFDTGGLARTPGSPNSGEPARASSRSTNHTNVSRKLTFATNSFSKLLELFDELFCERVDPNRPIRRINIACGHLEPEEYATYSLFSDVAAEEEERARQDALLEIKHRFGKDAVMRGTSYKEKARGIERAHQVGGHHA